MPNPKGKNKLQTDIQAVDRFDTLLQDLARSKQADYVFTADDDDADVITISICNCELVLRSDGTYTVE